jgi:steroid 5-alpha reductase family enzyme
MVVQMLKKTLAISCGFQLAAYAGSTFYRAEPTERYYDLSGAATHLAIASHAVVTSGRNPRVVLLATLSSVWALRLGGYLYDRLHRIGKDDRFTALKRDRLTWLVPWGLQAVWCFALQAPLSVAASTGAASKLCRKDAIGAAIFLGGLVFESVADAQKDAFKRLHKSAPMTEGLFAYSVYANYFGECTLWWGQFLLALPAATNWLQVLVAAAAPVLDCLLLWTVSGIPMSEKSVWRKYGSDPMYLDYRARTSVFFPLPPNSVALPAEMARVRRLATLHSGPALPIQDRPSR